MNNLQSTALRALSKHLDRCGANKDKVAASNAIQTLAAQSLLLPGSDKDLKAGLSKIRDGRFFCQTLVHSVRMEVHYVKVVEALQLKSVDPEQDLAEAHFVMKKTMETLAKIAKIRRKRIVDIGMLRKLDHEGWVHKEELDACRNRFIVHEIPVYF